MTNPEVVQSVSWQSANWPTQIGLSTNCQATNVIIRTFQNWLLYTARIFPNEQNEDIRSSLRVKLPPISGDHSLLQSRNSLPEALRHIPVASTFKSHLITELLIVSWQLDSIFNISNSLKFGQDYTDFISFNKFHSFPPFRIKVYIVQRLRSDSVGGTIQISSPTDLSINDNMNSLRKLDLVGADNDGVVQQIANLKQCFTTLRLALQSLIVATPNAVLDQRRQSTQLRYRQRLHSHHPCY